MRLFLATVSFLVERHLLPDLLFLRYDFTVMLFPLRTWVYSVTRFRRLLCDFAIYLTEIKLLS